MSDRTYTLDDLESDLWHLYHQLDKVVEIMQGLHHERPIPGAHTEQDQCDAMAWIARDLAEKVAKAVDGIEVRSVPATHLQGRVK